MTVLTKRLLVVVVGTGQIHDIEIRPATTAGDILTELDLKDYLLSKGPAEPIFAADDSVYDKVGDWEKLFASTKAVVCDSAPLETKNCSWSLF